MARFKSTRKGRIPFTAEEEAEWDAMEAETAANVDNNRALEKRETRNYLLSESDWMSGTDVTMPDNWKIYRQSLRDLPTHSNWPNLKDTDWPDKP